MHVAKPPRGGFVFRGMETCKNDRARVEYSHSVSPHATRALDEVHIIGRIQTYCGRAIDTRVGIITQRSGGRHAFMRTGEVRFSFTELLS
jgi:hypothetical protein